MTPPARRVRIVALTAVLLCMVGLTAPIIARAHAGSHSRIRAMKIVNTVTSDQAPGALRLDQPALAAEGAPRTHALTSTLTLAAATPATVSATVDVARTRGPPMDAVHL